MCAPLSLALLLLPLLASGQGPNDRTVAAARKRTEEACGWVRDCRTNPYCTQAQLAHYYTACESDQRIFSQASEIDRQLSCGASCSERVLADLRPRIDRLIDSCEKVRYCGLLAWLFYLQTAADPAKRPIQNMEAIEGALAPLQASFDTLDTDLQSLTEGPWTPGDCPPALRQRLSEFNGKAGAAVADLDAVQYRLALENNFMRQDARMAEELANALSQRVGPMQSRLRAFADLRCPGLTAIWRSETMAATASPALKPKAMRLQTPDFNGERPSPDSPAVWGGLADKPRVSVAFSGLRPKKVVLPPVPAYFAQARKAYIGRYDSWDWLPLTSLTNLSGRLERAVGLTKTVGDPLHRAAFVFLQSQGDCAVVSQQEVLTAAGLLDPAHPKENERRLLQEAGDLGLLADSHGGLTSYRMGALLVRHGLSIRRKDGASPKELLGAVKEGKWIIVGVNSGILWNEPHGGGHAVVVTGAELERMTGIPVGFYVNDSGIGVGARLVGAEQFLRAWMAFGRTLIVVQ